MRTFTVSYVVCLGASAKDVQHRTDVYQPYTDVIWKLVSGPCNGIRGSTRQLLYFTITTATVVPFLPYPRVLRERNLKNKQAQHRFM